MLLPEVESRIILKNLRALFLLGDFYKADEIERKVSESNYQQKTKMQMLDFIDRVGIHKSADLAAAAFENVYGKKALLRILRRFLEIEVVPVPIAVKKNLTSWSFME